MISHERLRRDDQPPAELSPLRPAAARALLGNLLMIGALAAFAGGWYGMMGARGIPIDWLDLSAFDDYFIPSLVLFVVVGGSCLTAAVAVLAGWHAGRRLAQAAGVVVLAFSAVELAIIGSAWWFQPVAAVGAALMLALARTLPR